MGRFAALRRRKSKHYGSLLAPQLPSLGTIFGYPVTDDPELNFGSDQFLLARRVALHLYAP